MEPSYILTAELDGDSFAWLDGLRRRHFPPERNFLSAHLTLFHQLSETQVNGLRLFELPRAPLALRFDHVVFLGFGVAFHAECLELQQLRTATRGAMGGSFSRQDSQPWKPHVTIQNKVSPEIARCLHQKLQNDCTERAGAATGLLVWQYLGGPWKLVERLGFGC